MSCHIRNPYLPVPEKFLKEKPRGIAPAGLWMFRMEGR